MSSALPESACIEASVASSAGSMKPSDSAKSASRCSPIRNLLISVPIPIATAATPTIASPDIASERALTPIAETFAEIPIFASDAAAPAPRTSLKAEIRFRICGRKIPIVPTIPISAVAIPARTKITPWTESGRSPKAEAIDVKASTIGIATSIIFVRTGISASPIFDWSRSTAFDRNIDCDSKVANRRAASSVRALVSMIASSAMSSASENVSTPSEAASIAF